MSRINLRMPEHLKARVELAADAGELVGELVARPRRRGPTGAEATGARRAARARARRPALPRAGLDSRHGQRRRSKDRDEDLRNPRAPSPSTWSSAWGRPDRRERALRHHRRGARRATHGRRAMSRPRSRRGSSSRTARSRSGRPKSGWKQMGLAAGGESVDVRVGLPTGSRVRVDAGVATLRSTGRLGSAGSRRASGDVSSTRSAPWSSRPAPVTSPSTALAGRAELVSGSGSMRIASIDGPAAVKNSNGDTWIGEVTGEARVSAANGTITIDRAERRRRGQDGQGRRPTWVTSRTAPSSPRARSAAWRSASARAPPSGSTSTRSSARWRTSWTPRPAPGPNDDVVEVHAHTSYGDISVHRVLATADGEGSS